MKSDTTNTSERRVITPSAIRSSSASCVPAGRTPGAAWARGMRMRASSSSTWARLVRGGSTVSTRWPYSTAPARLPWRVITRASVATKPLETASLVTSPLPKSTLPDRSSRNHAVMSRSSRNWRT